MNRIQVTRESLLEQAKEIYDSLDDKSKASFVAFLEGLGTLTSRNLEGTASELRKHYGKLEQAIALENSAEDMELFFANLAIHVDGRLEKHVHKDS